MGHPSATSAITAGIQATPPAELLRAAARPSHLPRLPHFGLLSLDGPPSSPQSFARREATAFTALSPLTTGAQAHGPTCRRVFLIHLPESGTGLGWSSLKFPQPRTAHPEVKPHVPNLLAKQLEQVMQTSLVPHILPAFLALPLLSTWSLQRGATNY